RRADRGQPHVAVGGHLLLRVGRGQRGLPDGQRGFPRGDAGPGHRAVLRPGDGDRRAGGAGPVRRLAGAARPAVALSRVRGGREAHRPNEGRAMAAAGASERQVALITGAGGGLGKALALELARAGYALAGVDLQAEGLAELGRELKQAGTPAATEPADVTDA